MENEEILFTTVTTHIVVLKLLEGTVTSVITSRSGLFSVRNQDDMGNEIT